MTLAVVTGYASLDYAVRLDRAPRPDETATILSRPAPWPRLGGSPAYVAAALVAGGVADAVPISWVGKDADGQIYLEALAARRVSTSGVARLAGRTPVCLLAYQPDGGCHCFYDPGLTEAAALNAHQRDMIGLADWVCLTVGPREVTHALLDALRPEAKLVWAVKADARAVPPDLAARIAARADIVSFSRREAAFAARACSAGAPRQGQWLIETRGEDGVALTRDGDAEIFAVEPIAAEDTTGAGDTFLGGFIAGLISGQGAAEAVASGARAARRMLAARIAPEENA
jgi:ribokinase